MKQIFASANEFVRQSDWKDLAVLKFCLLSLGLLAGMRIAEKRKKGVRITASVVFVLTYIPLMAKYLRIFTQLGYSISKSDTKRNTADTCF